MDKNKLNEDFAELFTEDEETALAPVEKEREIIPAINKYKMPEMTEEVEHKILHIQQISKAIDAVENAIVPHEIDNKMKIDYEGDLNPSQYNAVTTTEGPMLIIAGAGSGKTRTLSYRVAYMIEKGIRPDNILLLTFTRKASKEMLDRSRALLNDSKIESITGGTFHAFANAVLRKYSKVLELNPKFTIIDTIDSQDVVDLVRRELKFEKKDKAFPKKGLIQKIISKSRNCEKSISEIIRAEHITLEEYIEDIEKIYELYMAYNRIHHQLDYDDLLDRLYESLANNLHFQDMMHRKYKYIMVDEFQDTNVVQKKIVDLLAEKTKNVMVVGDDSQSIYGFRGANFENILLFPETYPECKVVKLEQNYRSRQELLNFTNDVVDHFQMGYKKSLYSQDKRDGLPNICMMFNQEDEAKWIADQVIELMEKQVSLKNIAVLYRASYHSNYLQAELIKRNIPFIVYGGIKFIERRHVKDMIAYLRLLLNPLDAVAWNRVLKLITGIGTITASGIVKSIRDNNGVIDFEKYKGKKFYENLSRLGEVLSANLEEDKWIVDKIESLKGYYTPLLKALEHDYEIRLQDIDVLITLAAKYDNKLEKYLSDFALDPPSNQFQDTVAPVVDDDDGEKLVLSTVHSAKGLEWSYVFVMHMLDGLFPTSKSIGTIEQIEEERRLFYVASTRAKEQLYITMPSYVSSYHDYFTKPSRFVAEIAKDKYELIVGI